MNWSHIRRFPWIDTRANFVACLPQSGSLLDLGSSDGETLRHMAELRPDLNLFSVDLEGKPEAYPHGCQFQRRNLETDRLPWPDASMDGITCMHVVEHLRSLDSLIRECARLLKPGARVYFETPHAKTVHVPSARQYPNCTFTLNFFDDPTHVRPIAIGELEQALKAVGLLREKMGISRNLIFAASYPLFCLLPVSRKKLTARVHWMGWSAYLIAQRR